MAVGFVYFLIFFNWIAIFFPIMMTSFGILIIIGNFYLFKYQRIMIGFTDKRAKLTAECLSGIKNIKFECWETISVDRLNGYRKKESENLFLYFLIRLLLNSLADIFVPAFLLVFLTIYTSNYGPIPIDKAYLLISLANQGQTPLKALITLIDGWASVKLAL